MASISEIGLQEPVRGTGARLKSSVVESPRALVAVAWLGNRRVGGGDSRRYLA
jgi:hypothetical protein